MGRSIEQNELASLRALLADPPGADVLLLLDESFVYFSLSSIRSLDRAANPWPAGPCSMQACGLVAARECWCLLPPVGLGL